MIEVFKDLSPEDRTEWIRVMEVMAKVEFLNADEIINWEAPDAEAS